MFNSLDWRWSDFDGLNKKSHKQVAHRAAITMIATTTPIHPEAPTSSREGSPN